MQLNQRTFDDKFQEILKEMESEGKLVPFILSYGEIYIQLADELNNEIVKRITDGA